MRQIMLMAALCAATAPLAPTASAQGSVHIMEVGRPRLGITLKMRAGADDKVGAHVQSVTPDGPADKAGLKEGDIITRFNGTSLAGVSAEDEDQSGPAYKLLSLVRKVDDGDTMKVEYKRGNDTKTATIIAKDLNGGELGMQRWKVGPDGGNFNFRMPVMGMAPRGFAFSGPNGANMFRMRFNRGLDLIDLNADLGDYFGTKEGVLVVSSPSDSAVPLKAGDVILSLDGRKPKSAAHAQRILDSYDAGETIKAELMRKQKHITLTWTAPEMKGGMMWKMDGGDSDDEDTPHPRMKMREQSGHPAQPPPPPSERS
jgi:S1-C subfamily serine protease